MAEEPVVIPAYGYPRPARARMPGWLSFLLALPVYFLVLWAVVNPRDPLPLLVRAAIGFLGAGLSAGAVTGRRGWLAGLLGFVLVVILALITLLVTVSISGLGPSFLINGDTAHGDTAAVGNVRGDLVRELLYMTVGAGLLSALGGELGSVMRRRSR